MASVFATALPRSASRAFFSSPRWTSYKAVAPILAVALPGITWKLPALLDDIWESVLRAVPKNKVSHSRKRHRQMAGKALKDVNSLTKCPGCGEEKRSHRICPNCLEDFKDIWKQDNPVGKTSQ